MGKGDKKTKRGKLFSGSYGVTRPRKKSKVNVAPSAPVKATVRKKTATPKAQTEKVVAPKKAAESKPKTQAKKVEKAAPDVKEPQKKTKVVAKKEEEAAPKKKADKKDK